MGVDASIYAKNAKIELVADRSWVFDAWDMDIDLMVEFRNRFCDSKRGLDKRDVLTYLAICELSHKKNYEGTESGRLEYAQYWLNQVRKFVDKYPDDMFFMLNDNDDEYFETKGYKKSDPLEEK